MRARMPIDAIPGAPYGPPPFTHGSEKPPPNLRPGKQAGFPENIMRDFKISQA
jgi:hypothetical protein